MKLSLAFLSGTVVAVALLAAGSGPLAPRPAAAERQRGAPDGAPPRPAGDRGAGAAPSRSDGSGATAATPGPDGAESRDSEAMPGSGGAGSDGSEATVATPGSGGADAAPPTGARFAVVSSLAKVRPGDDVRGADAIALRALRGECESAQIAARAGRAPLRLAPKLVGDLGAGVDVRLHRVALVHLERPSGPEGAAGVWPDPLVPAVDRYVGEARNAFPLPVPAGESRSILVEVCVDRQAAPGARAAAIDLGPLRVPIALRVEHAAIPATASLPTSFGFSSRRAALGHHGAPLDPDALLRLDALYRKALLHHRLSVHGGTFDPPPFRRVDGRIEIDFTRYDRELAPFLEGKALPSGARATTTELRTHPGLASDEERVAYWRAIVAHHRARGWEALLFDYARDEPKREELPAVLARAKLVKKADPAIRVLLTASLDPALVGAVDLWAPNLNCLFVKERPDEWCAWRAPRHAYRRAQEQGALLWWYQSCSSHGCDGEAIVGARDAKGDYFRGWPSYVVDAPGSRARAMAWLAWAEGIGGELYWDTVHAYAPDGAPRDPWAPGGLWAFGGNGEGTLLYPGRPERIGGATHVPVESLRLHHVRDGLEDYELLRLVAALPGGEAVARRAARRVAPSPGAVTDDPAAVEEARRMLLDRLAAGAGAGGGE